MLRLMSDLRAIKQEPPEARRAHTRRRRPLSVVRRVTCVTTAMRPPLPAQGCSASPHSEENLFVWGATIFGPDETPWEARAPCRHAAPRCACAERACAGNCRAPFQGGVFSLRITFSEHYPDKPPRVRFTSEVFHPNGAGA